MHGSPRQSEAIEEANQPDGRVHILRDINPADRGPYSKDFREAGMGFQEQLYVDENFLFPCIDYAHGPLVILITQV